MTAAPIAIDWDRWKFDNRFTRELPGDPVTLNQRRQVKGAFYSRVLPTPVSKPQLIAYSREMGEILGIEGDPYANEEFAQVFSGNRKLPGMDPFAMCYGGHQFGNWAGQLGDGRAINLGEVINPKGEHWMVQLKGAGPTPYSRNADGLAVLRSSVREFLCSEAMHHLGVPTTRALSLVLTGEQVMRDMFYDGNPQYEPGAVVCRVAPTFTRFGNFQIFVSRGESERLKQLVDYTIRHDFPQLGEPGPETYVAWFAEVCRLTAVMIVHWMRVGFVHGVMNTDNMSILGLTIDYGPYGWLEDYDPHWTPNTTDAQGRRYRFGQQPQIALWNLAQLGNCLVELVGAVEPLQAALASYSKAYEQGWDAMMAQKLGLAQFVEATDRDLINDLLQLLFDSEADMTIFYRRLAQLSSERMLEEFSLLASPLGEAFYRPDLINAEIQARWLAWLGRYRARLNADALPDRVRAERMNRVNPKYVLRNYLAQVAIDASEKGDHGKINELLDLLRRPYDEQPERESYFAKRPEWARHRAGCSMLSCSS